MHKPKKAIGMTAQISAAPPPTAGETQPTFGEFFKVWLKIGCINFGGPAGQIAMMHRIVVDEKKWIDEPRFLHALNFCMLLPGPEAQKLATYIGWLLHGVRGGLAAGILFVLPGAFVMLGLSLLYALGRGVALVDGALFGIKAAVLVIVVEALIRIGRRALKTSALVALAGLCVRRHLLLRPAVPADRRGRGARRIPGRPIGPGPSSACPAQAPIRRAARAGPRPAGRYRVHRRPRWPGGRRSRSSPSRSARTTCW